HFAMGNARDGNNSHPRSRPEGVPVAIFKNAQVKEHVRQCKKGPASCGLCAWATAPWRTKANAGRLKLAYTATRRARVGCSVCCKARFSGPWANFEMKPRALRWQFVNRHATSKGHLQAAESSKHKKGLLCAPTASEFREALMSMWRGGSARQNGVASDKKSRMRYCIAEAVLMEARAFLSEAASIALLCDERKGRLLLRFRASQANLQTLSGVIGYLPVDGTAEGVSEGTQRAIRTFCQPFTELPRSSAIDTPPRDSSCECRIRQKTNILVTDAAPSELLASEQLRGRRAIATEGDVVEPALPGVRLVGRDAAHATTRLLKKPFENHPEIRQVMTEFITGKHSFAQKIQNSPLLAQWWQEKVRLHADQDGNNDENLGFAEACGRAAAASISAAKHRFGSYARPLVRIVRNLKAMVALLHKVAAMRGSGDDDDNGWAFRILQGLTARKLLLLALAADAATTVLDFTRFADDESVDIAELNSRAGFFVRQVHAQFIDGQVWTLPTCAKTCVEVLTGSAIVVMHGGTARKLRLTSACRTWALDVLKDWTSATEAVLKAEFPSWHLFACFECFNLQGVNARLQLRSAAVKQHLAKLSQAFGVNASDLESEYSNLLPIACGLMEQSSLDNRSAWRQALERTQGKKAYQVTALRTVLAAYVAWSCSTSGVEQSFSVLKRSPAELASARIDTDRRLATVMGCRDLHKNPARQDALVESARRIYASTTQSQKPARKITKIRFDKGVAKKISEGSEAEWLRKRSAAVQEAADGLATPAKRTKRELPESLEKEVNRQRQLAKVRKADAYLDGYLLPSEVTCTMAADVKDRLQKNAANDRKRASEMTQKTALLGMATVTKSHDWALQGLPPGPALLGRDNTTWKFQLAALGVDAFTEDLRQANLILVDDSTNIPRKQQVLAALRGGVLLSASILDGKLGFRMQYRRALDDAVAVHMTDKFKKEHVSLSMCVQYACSNGWCEVTLRGLVSRGCDAVLLLMAGKEKKPDNLANRTTCLDAKGFVRWLAEKYVKPTQSARILAGNPDRPAMALKRKFEMTKKSTATPKTQKQSTASPKKQRFARQAAKRISAGPSIGSDDSKRISAGPSIGSDDSKISSRALTLKERIHTMKKEIVKLANTWSQRLPRHSETLAKGHKIRIGADCAGYGSELIAFTQLGLRESVEVTMLSEKDKTKQILHAAVAKACSISVKKASLYADIMQREDMEAPACDVFTAGYPCPSWSKAGLKAGLNDERGLVLLKGLQYLAAKRPRTAILEQVPGILEDKHKKMWGFLLKVLESLNYCTAWGILNTMEHGLPQRRRRVYVMAIARECVKDPKMVRLPAKRTDDLPPL
ncbi:ngoBVM, partial [Symbiodinium necroappetens]